MLAGGALAVFLAEPGAAASEPWTLERARRAARVRWSVTEVEGWARQRLAEAQATHGAESLEAAGFMDLVIEAKCAFNDNRCFDQEMRDFAIQTLAIKERLLEPDALELFQTLWNASRVVSGFDALGAKTSSDRARGIWEAHALRSLVEAEAAHGSKSLEAAKATDVLVLGRCRFAVCDTEESRNLSILALANKERVLGLDSLELVPTLRNVAATAGSRRISDSIHATERALAIADRELHPDDLTVIQLLEDLTRHYQDVGRWNQLVPIRKRFLEAQERQSGTDSPDVAWASHSVAKAAYNDGQYGLASQLVERAVTLWEKTGLVEDSRYPASLNLRGLIRMSEGDLVVARRDLETALELRERFFRAEIGQSFHNLGSLLDLAGDLREAQRFAERTVQMWTEQRGPDDPEVALAKLGLGEVLLRQGEAEAARREFTRAQAILDKTKSPEALYYPLVLMGMGRALIQLGEDAEAERVLRWALDLLLQRSRADHPVVMRVLALLSRLDLSHGHLQEARENAEAAFKIAEERLGPDHPEVAEILADLAAVARAEGRASEAMSHALRALGIDVQNLRRTARGLPERQALKYAEAKNSRADQLLSLAAGAPAEAPWERILDALIRSRALVLDELALRNRTVFASTEDSEVARLARDLERARARLAVLILGSPDEDEPGEHRDALAAAIREKEMLERALAEKSLAFRQQEEYSKAGLTHVLGALPEGAALVSYFRYGWEPASYAAFVLRAEAPALRFVPLGPAGRIEHAIESWRDEAARRPPTLTRAAGKAEKRYREVAGRLRALIWDPLEKYLGGSSRAFVVPDGAIHMVSLATLPGGGGRYLLETGPVLHYLSAERDLVRQPGTSSSGTLFALGGADFDASPAAVRHTPAAATATAATPTSVHRGPTSECPDFRTMRFEPLPFTTEEVRDVKSFWDGDGMAQAPEIRMIVGSEATEAAFRREAPRYRILHVATHGFFLGTDCADQPSSAPQMRENPLLRSGLALAGASRRLPAGALDGALDGILTAEEIASVDLSGVQLAVLSACSTGLGQIEAGEGVLGLRRAFQIAGAQTLIMSLWPVSDEATRAWMRELYQFRRGRGMSTADAVHDASLRLLAARRSARKDTHPFHWGAFVGLGDWR